MTPHSIEEFRSDENAFRAAGGRSGRFTSENGDSGGTIEVVDMSRVAFLVERRRDGEGFEEVAAIVVVADRSVKVSRLRLVRRYPPCYSCVRMVPVSMNYQNTWEFLCCA